MSSIKSKNFIKFFKEYGIVILIILALEAFYFRNIILSDAMIGDFGDGKFCMLATEHWFQVLLGNESLSTMQMFYPVTGSFAYSDMFLGFALPFCIIRALGANMYLAFKITTLFIHAVGAFSAYVLVHKEVKVGKYLSIVGVIIFSYANMVNTSAHPQLYAIYLIPVFAICVVEYFKHVMAPLKTRIKWAVLSLLSFALVFYTGSYVGYFIVVAAFVFVLVYVVVTLISQREYLKNVLLYIKKHIVEILAYAAGGVALLIPYLVFTSPMTKQFGSRPWEDIATYLLNWREFFYLSNRSLLWNKVLHVNVAPAAAESQNGFPVGTFVVFVLAVLICVLQYIVKRQEAKEQKKNVELSGMIMLLIGISTCVCLALILKIDGKSLWYFIYKYGPGAGSMRAVSRFNDILTLPMGVMIAWFVDGMMVSIKENKVAYGAAIFMVLAYFTLEYTWVDGIYTGWRIEQELAFEDSVPEPPADCETMFILYKPEEIKLEAYTTYHLQAWQIAHKYHIHSINGYTSYYPQGWEPMNRLYEDGYADHVREWITTYGLTGVYAYVVSDHEWVKYS